MSKASTIAKNKYNQKNYDRLYPLVQKGKKDIYRSAAEILNISLNSFIEQACDKYAEETQRGAIENDKHL